MYIIIYFDFIQGVIEKSVYEVDYYKWVVVSKKILIFTDSDVNYAVHLNK